jgi:hypothetical protein
MTARRDDARAALEEHADGLRRRKNVVGLGVTKRADGTGDAVAVYVRRKERLDELDPADRIPATVTVTRGGRAVEVPVEVVDVGGDLAPE